MSQRIENAREKLMDAGRQYLLQNRDGGGEKFSVRAVTAQCDMALGTFYRYFESKDDLIQQILAAEWGAAIDALDPIIEGDAPLYEKVRGIYGQICTFEENYRYSAAALLNRSAENAAFRETHMQRMYDRIEQFLQHEIARGSLVLSADLSSASYLLVQLFIATGRNPKMDFDDLWACMIFRDTSA